MEGRALRFCYQCLADFTALDANPSCDSCGNEPAEHEFVPASQLRTAVDALRELCEAVVENNARPGTTYSHRVRDALERADSIFGER